MNDIQEKITDYLAAHRYLTLATVTGENEPLAHTVEYVSEGATVYFLTYLNSRKVRDISRDSHVAFTVDESYENIRDIQGVQMEGTAEILTAADEIEHARKLYITKYPELASMPPSPDSVFVRVRPAEGFFIDNTREIGHRDRVEFQPSETMNR